MGWFFKLSALVVLLGVAASFMGKRWNARGGVFDPLPLPLDPLEHSGRGKVAVVTGGNIGLGFEVSRQLYNVGYKVIIACRNKEKGKQAKKQIQELEPDATGHLKVFELDLSSFESVREFGNAFDRAENRLDILVNNAGIWSNQEKTDSGISRTAQINHYAGFLLTNLLLPKLREAEGNVVIVSSTLHSLGIDFRNDPKLLDPEILTRKTTPPNGTMYGTSKLMNVLHAKHAAKKVKDVRFNSIHPGIFHSSLHRPENDESGKSVLFTKFIQPVLYRVIGIPASQAGYAVANLAVQTKYTGRYFHGLLPRETKGLANDEKLEKFLWDISVDLTNSDENRGQ